MLGIPRRFSHFVFGIIQSGLTCAVAAAVASHPFLTQGSFVMLPVVVFAAPIIRKLTYVLTRDEDSGRTPHPIESRLD
jgi:hypothetical protein